MQAETYLWMNSVFCLCAFLLGGKMAGLSILSPGRLMLASLMGGICALGLYAWPSVLWLTAIPFQLFLCFGTRPLAQYLRVLAMIAACFALAAGIAAFCLKWASAKAWAFPAACLMQLLLCLFLKSRHLSEESVRQVEISRNGKSLLLPAMLDSGNLLRDPVTGQCVIVAPLRAAARMEPELLLWYQQHRLPQGFRLLRVRTAAGSCLMPLFRPDSCCLYVNGRKAPAEVMVAVAGPDYGGFQALVPSAALDALCKNCPDFSG